MAKSLSVNKSDLKTIRNLFLLLLVGLYVYLNYMHPCSKRLVFLLVTTILTFYLFNDIYCAILLSIVLSVAFSLLCKKHDVIEGMEDNHDNEKNEEHSERNKEDLTVQTMTDKKKKEKENEKDDEQFSDNFIDYNETMRNNLKNLDVKNIEKMTNETKELLNTQKQLMQTMAEMTPLLKKGMGMVEMFKKKKE